MIWLWFGACALLAFLIIVKRKEMAEFQSMIAGGTVFPGCIIAEGLLILLLGVVGIVAWAAGLLD